MSIEVVLFLIVGSVAVFAAAAMLNTDNAVYSALYLILNFACVAFLYLMLDAPFLSLVQIAVYAGAIMVLFLFVIMLLGAERTLHEVRQFKWLAPLTMILAVSFLTVLSIAFVSGPLDNQAAPEPAPLLRVVNTTPDFPDADFYLDGELFAENVPFGGTSDAYAVNFHEVIEGEHTLGIAQAGSDSRALPLGTFTIEAGQALTLFSYGVIGTDIRPTLAVVEEDADFYTDAGGRLSILNLYGETPVALVDAGTDMILHDAEVSDPVIVVSDLPLGVPTDSRLERAGPKDWVFVQAEDGAITGNVIARADGFAIQNTSLNLLVLAVDRDGDEMIPVAVPVNSRTLPQFGSPEAIGSILFTEYALPFEMVAMLLLAAMVGAIVLTQRTNIKPKPGRPIRRKVSRPLTSVIALQTGHAITMEGINAEPEVEEPELGTAETGD